MLSQGSSSQLINIPAATSPTTATNGTFDAKFDAVFGNQPATSQSSGKGPSSRHFNALLTERIPSSARCFNKLAQSCCPQLKTNTDIA